MMFTQRINLDITHHDHVFVRLFEDATTHYIVDGHLVSPREPPQGCFDAFGRV